MKIRYLRFKDLHMGEVDFYTLDEMAKKLKVSKQRIYHLIHSRDI